MRYFHKIAVFAAAAMIMLSCSTTRVLKDGEYRLADNKIKIVNDKNFNSSILEPYLKQKPNSYFIFGWNPFLNVYNWANGKDKGWDKFVKKIGVAPVVYDSEMVDNSIVNIDNHLEYLGYYGSTTESEIQVKRKKVYVTYKVKLGKRIPIRNIEISLPEGGEFPQAFMSDTASSSIRPGDYLSESSLEAETVRSAQSLKNMGFYSFSKNNFFFEADTLSYPGSAVLKMRINEYTRNESEKDAKPISRFYINDVKITYPKSMKIRENILRDLNMIRPGEVYNEKVINNTYNRFTALRMFSSVNIGMTQVDTNLIDCEISLSQSRNQGFKVNLEASTNSSGLLGISPQLSYFHKNIFRGGEWLNLSFMGNFQFKFNDSVRSNEFGVSGSLSLPRFLFIPYKYFSGNIPRTDINLSYNYQDRPEYTRNILSTSLGFSGNIKNRFFYQAYPLQLNIVRLFDMDRDFYESLSDDPFMRNAYQDHFDLGLGTTLYYTTDSSTNPQNTYFYTRFQFDLSGNVLSAFKPLMDKDANGAGMIWNTPFSQYTRAELTLGKTWVFGKNSGQAIATRLLVGAGHAYGNSNALPFEKHFYAGGASSLRGWQARTVGPGMSQNDTTFVIPNQTGDMKLEANIEYRFNMFWKVDGAVFVDAGNVWQLKEHGEDDGNKEGMFRWDKFGQSIAANWGAGVRVNLGFLLLRIDMGIKLHDPSRKQRWVRPADWLKQENFALHFGVGYPF